MCVCTIYGNPQRPPPVSCRLAFTRHSFVDAVIVHESILLLARDTFDAPRLYVAVDFGQRTRFPPEPPVLSFNI